MFAPLCRLRSIATRSPVAGATVSFQEKVIGWGRGAAHAFYAARAYTPMAVPFICSIGEILYMLIIECFT